MMELLLIRHALPVRREDTDGPADPELSEIGIAQAKRLGEWLAAEEIAAVYSSPMRRAMQTAQPVADAHVLDIIASDGIAEYDRNATTYVPIEESRAANDERWQSLQRGDWHGDESEDDFHHRVHDGIERIVRSHPSERIAVVCHGGVINSYLADVLSTPHRRGFFYPAYTGISRVAASAEGRRSIVSINETAHLRGSGLPVGLTAL
jgi:probable phosphoglycerate mutase